MANTFMFASESPITAAALLSDQALLDTTARVAGDERRTTAELLALLAELDTRKLYLGEGYSSLFTYCTQRLRLSESAAYSRITVARAARRFPIVLTRLAEGDVTLTSISLLAGHLSDDNHESLLDAVRHASRRDVERLIASLHAQPDIPASVRRVPNSGGPPKLGVLVTDSANETPLTLLAGAVADKSTQTYSIPRPAPRPVLASLAADRYLLRVTIGASAHAKLERARDLLRHTVPNGDPAVIIDRALTVLVEQLERRKAGLVSRPSAAMPNAKRPRGRHVPATVKRAVWTRDQGQCAFVGPHGRCHETGFLEYHHVVPYASGGATDATNLELRCRAHNAHEAAVFVDEEERPVTRGTAH